MRRKIIFLGMFLIAIGLFGCGTEVTTDAPGMGVTRLIAENSVNAGDTITVKLAVRVPEGVTFYAIDEILPEGAEVISPAGGSTEDPGHLKWVVIQKAADTDYDYQIRLSNPGTATWKGEYAFEGDKEALAMQGNNQIIVS